MKRKILTALIAIIMSASLAFGFTACFVGSNETTPDDGGTSQTDPDDEGGNTDPDDGGTTDPDDGQGGAGDGHTHTFADAWSFDAQNHWHAATCGHDERAYIAAHVIADGACTVCGAVLEGTEGLEYTLSQDESYYIVSGIGTATAKDIVIPSIYNDLPVAAIGDMAFYGCTSLTSIIIPDGVTSIDYAAFNSCSSLESVTIPDRVTFMGFAAFENCSSLKSVYITDIAAWCGIEFDGLYANPLCSAGNLYLNGELVTELVIPEGVTSIGIFAFTNCTSIESITIPDSVTSIGYGAFICPSLEYNEYGNTLYLGNQNNPYFALIALNAASCKINGDTKIAADGAFSPIYTTIENISVDEDNEYFTAVDGILFDKDCKILICYPAGKNSTTYTIPDGIISIGNWAFSWCESLESITIPDSVTYIGDAAFSVCSSLKSITIPDNVTSIGFNTFTNCSSLSSITIPDSVTYIGMEAFLYCTSLESITIPNSVTYIDMHAFANCTALKSITVPDSVTYIGMEAFYYCDSLTSITIPDSVTYIGMEAFWRCDSLETVYYTGNEEDWEKLVDGKDLGLEDVEIVYNYKG